MASGFVMKILSEVVHEVFGHGLFVLLFGGEITGLRISVLWPYELSRIIGIYQAPLLLGN